MPEKRQKLFEASSLKRKPSDDEIEITLFGKGVGECIVVHLGGGRYAIIDSFINSETKKAIALDYLEAMGVSAECIDCVITTHWHKDHILGINQLAKSVHDDARFVMPAIINDECFSRFLEINKKQLNSQSPVTEFCSALSTIIERKLHIVLATNDKLIFKGKAAKTRIGNEYISLYTLSPNDEQLLNYLENMKNLVNQQANRPSYTFIAENDISIVLWLDFVGDRALLGGDLEKNGWKAIVDNTLVTGEASLFKVPHHGSVTGHLDLVWEKLLASKPIALLSVYSPSGLPDDDDKSRIKALSRCMYVAGDHAAILNRPDFFKKLNKCSSVELRSLDSPIGMVRARKSIKSTADWSIECFGQVQSV